MSALLLKHVRDSPPSFCRMRVPIVLPVFYRQAFDSWELLIIIGYSGDKDVVRRPRPMSATNMDFSRNRGYTRTMVFKILSVFSFGLVAIAGVQFGQIGERVGAAGEAAVERYSLSTIESLHALVSDPTAPYPDRNEAIWALGQIGSKTSLPVLEPLDTDEVQERPLNGTNQIVQYTVEKSIRQIKSPFIATRWMYRDIRSE